ncbi:MAG TPA: hypothetical protein VLA31_09175, partial [Burkholderiaceae bacterium]|nr:hypothetical protein [Burkholderiaceae bacterium]
CPGPPRSNATGPLGDFSIFAPCDGPLDVAAISTFGSFIVDVFGILAEFLASNCPIVGPHHGDFSILAPRDGLLDVAAICTFGSFIVGVFGIFAEFFTANSLIVGTFQDDSSTVVPRGAPLVVAVCTVDSSIVGPFDSTIVEERPVDSPTVDGWFLSLPGTWLHQSVPASAGAYTPHQRVSWRVRECSACPAGARVLHMRWGAVQE